MIFREYKCILNKFLFIFNTIYPIKQELNTKPVVSIHLKFKTYNIYYNLLTYRIIRLVECTYIEI